MAQTQFAKHEQWIKEHLVPNLMKNQKLSVNDIKVKSIEIKPVSFETTFMLSCCYFVKINLETSQQCSSGKSDDANQTEFDLVVKVGDLNIYAGVRDYFMLEILAYNDIIPKLKCLTKTPKCYYSHNGADETFLVLSNFSNSGWQMAKSRFNLPLDHIFAAVKHLGEFHGEMYAMKITDAATFNSIRKTLTVPRFALNESSFPSLLLYEELGIRRATSSVRASAEMKRIVPETFLKRLEEIMYKSYEYRAKCSQPIEPLAIICHGDYTRNNIAFRCDNDGKAIDAMMFDFQTLCYASPMFDLCTLLAISMGHEVRDRFFWGIFSAYHESLIGSFLATSKWRESNIPSYLTYDRLLEEYARYIPFGLHLASSFLPMLHSYQVPSPFMSIADVVKLIFDSGAEPLNQEFCLFIVHIYQLYEKLKLKLE